jgi:aminoglycoside phosphotransferase family enzyme/predicted kinase
VDTAISHLFLGPRRVLKLKRAMRTNFLDFSTVALREAMCRREVVVNAAAGGLYRGVHAVRRGPRGLSLGGPGETVDWVVEMARFDTATEFDALAREGKLTLPLVEALADRVAALHATAPRRRGTGEAAAVEARIDQIAGAIGEADRNGALGSAAADWRAATQGERQRRARLIEARGRHGFVRRGHGDLHLGNICLWQGVPTPFDALEFNEAIATTDVLYDAGFTVMDLMEHGLPALAAGFLGRYLSATRDYAGLALLPLFVSMRAAVRAIGVAATDPELAARRLDFARTVLRPRRAPVLVAIGGPSGSGKSTLSRALAPATGAPFFAVVLRSDVARKRLAGLPPEAPLGAPAYTPGIGARVYARLFADARRCLRARFDAIVDASFLDARHQEAAERAAAAAGVVLHGFWLSAPAPVMAARIEARRGDASDATPVVLAQQLATHPDAPGWVHLDTSQPPEAVAAAARAALNGG